MKLNENTNNHNDNKHNDNRKQTQAKIIMNFVFLINKNITKNPVRAYSTYFFHPQNEILSRQKYFIII